MSLPGSRPESIENVCLRVTMFAIGVVRNLEKAPAKKPTPSSSMTGRWLLDDFEDRIRV